MFCTECGQSITEDAMFCTNCGSRISPLPVPVIAAEKNWSEVQQNVAASAGMSAVLEATAPDPQTVAIADEPKAKLDKASSICPYCRVLIDPSADSVIVCQHCETPHHSDCYQENGGCTVFGCQSAPADEPKLRVSSPELNHAYVAPMNHAAEPVQQTNDPSPDPIFTIPDDHKPKITFIFLGVVLGALGVHNFYAGYRKKGCIQLAITVLTLGYGAIMSWIWAIIDVCTVDCDSRGVQFKS